MISDDFQGQSPLSHEEMIRHTQTDWMTVLVAGTLMLMIAVALGIVIRVGLTLI